ncbi:unnamed protein product [Caenorhabditis angaria]|uniref:Uncharacterized protein n=1 Tax=Caenorhabditis angaria TaxID=860376 RepID=A0A9P1IB56_9PELO|nr:unnamed protein product [Caenorhabditis angaria]
MLVISNMASLPSSSGVFGRLLSNIIAPFNVSRCYASGRWWPQPAFRRFSSDLPNTNIVKTEKLGIELSKTSASPTYYTPKSPHNDGYELVEHKNGEMIANYTLFEASINKAKVPWINYDNLTSEERTIHMAHMKAINDRKLTYIDPTTKYTVFTISHHLKKGKCCGNGCRHCAYNMENAKEEVRSKKVWNGAFYI